MIPNIIYFYNKQTQNSVQLTKNGVRLIKTVFSQTVCCSIEHIKTQPAQLKKAVMFIFS